jgi:hypothetical protein
VTEIEVRVQMAKEIRQRTADGFERVKGAYGADYAAGWRSGRERLAELIEEGTIW